jgi:glyoxylate reductase
MGRVFLTRALPIDPREVLVPDHDAVVFAEDLPPTRDEIAMQAAGARAIVSLVTDRIDAALIDRLPSLAIVAQMAVGFDNVDVDACRARNVMVTHTPDTLTESPAELAFGLMLAVARRLHEGEAMVRGGAFRGWSPTMLLGVELDGKTLGVVGYGRIGRAIARRAAAFGMRVIAAEREDQPFAPDGIATHAPLSRLLEESDVVTLHCPGSPATRHLIGESQLARMKPGAILINTSRGTVVDEAALVRALERGAIGGAGLDVYEDEPRVHAGLLSRSNVVLLPHLGSATLEARSRMACMALTDARRVLEGKAPLHLVPTWSESAR